MDDNWDMIADNFDPDEEKQVKEEAKPTRNTDLYIGLPKRG